jgi:hypothetical protein
MSTNLWLLLSAVQDTVAYVPKAGGPPDSSRYMWAGYAVSLVAYGAYALLLLRRLADERRRVRDRHNG